VINTDHESPNYANPPVRSSLATVTSIFPVLYFESPSLYIYPSEWDTKFYTHTKP